ncbi:MAG TPA: SDR family NAD(P)-dependent oxidoreductase, partial [Gammaproteobacteria bacterium]|nr:SDR family NAD(P)-dependent oxidoreductase [Gammaproteobacteria bacterium]
MQNLERYLEGRVAIITGGFSGIGLSIGEALALRGAAVALGGRTVRDNAADAFRSKGASVFCGHLDVRDISSVQHFVNSVRSTLGPIDILVNSAGIGISQAVCGHPEDAWNDVIDTNLSGPFRTTRACLPGMIERQWGRIIHIGSTAARTAVADHPAYCASKSGLLGLSRAVSLEG